jgi:hypothetical protein
VTATIEATPATEPQPDVPQPDESTTAKDAATWAAGQALRHGRRFRRQLTPLAAMGAIYATGGLAHVLVDPLPVAIAAAGASALSWKLSGWKYRLPEQRAYAAVTTSAASMWVWAATVEGVGTPMPGWLTGLGGILALPWWWHYRLRPTRREVFAFDEQDIPEVEDPQVIAWRERVACTGGSLENSRLLDIEEIRGGWAATIELLKGSTDKAVRATKDIGAALRLQAGSIWIEPVATGELHLARILVLTDNPLQQPIMWDGPTLDVATGLSSMGQYADSDKVLYRHYRPGEGPVHSLIAGSTGSGKSVAVSQLLAEERHSGVIVSWVIDPQGGQSLPDWQDSAGEFARNIVEARELLTRARDRMYRRNAFMSSIRWTDDQGRERRGIAEFTPMDPRHLLPMLSITIDEAQTVLKDKICKALVEEMIGMSRKCGIKFRLITQVPLIGSLGNSQPIKDAVVAGNVIVLRTGTRLTGQAVLGGFPVDPSSLPKQWPDGSTTSGLGFARTSGSDRAAAMRVAYVSDVFGWASSGEPPELEPLDDDQDEQEPEAAPAGESKQDTPEPPAQPAAGDQDGIGERAVLVYLASAEVGGAECSRGDIILAIQRAHEAKGAPPPGFRTIVKALTDLTAAGLIERGNRGMYRITDRGLDRARAA